MPLATINDAQLYIEEQGAGPPIIFGHGYAGSHDSFTPLIERLRDRYRCITIDFRGAGDSPPAADGYTIDQFARDVVGLADHLGLDRFTYAGLSMGGAVGFQLGADHGDRLDKLVLIAPARSGGLSRPGRHDALLEMVRKDERARFWPAMATGFAREHSTSLLDARVARFFATSPEHLQRASEAMDSLRLSDRLGEIATPTLMIAGAADGLLASNLADFQRLPNATLHVFSRVGHQVTFDVPAALAHVIPDFLEHGVVTAATLQARLAAQPNPA